MAPPGPPPDPSAEGRLLSGRALAIVVISIALGAAYQGVVKLMERNQRVSLDSLIQWNIFLNIGLYAIVATLLVSQITPKVRLRWGEGSRLLRVAFGAALGLGGGGLLLALVSAASGHLSPDPRIVQTMGSGDLSHVLVVTGLACVAAPLVEETLFRGLLLESLRQHNTGMAIVVSAMLFAIWHLNSQALIYYSLMGAAFGGIYLKRGLLASMCAHAGFNGVLTVAAVAVVLGPSHTYDIGGLRVTAPGGWSQSATSSASANDPFGDASDDVLELDGPEGTSAVVFDLGPQAATLSPDEVASRLQQLTVPLPAGSTYDASSVREATLPTVGTAVEVNFTVHSSDGELVFFRYGSDGYMALAVTGDNTKAQHDVTTMLDTLQPAPAEASVS
ncbi:MAG TPA: CPBP family intramembrane glutamic endopeptidase [Mycobacteriales bacterium]|nr:CPBP family intramembrane glutamic endopeptidase [Mycobacteriales bacterium]